MLTPAADPADYPTDYPADFVVAAPVGDPIGSYLTDRMSVLIHSTPGPFRTSRSTGGSVHVTSHGTARRPTARPVATFRRDADARLFVDLSADLRALIGLVGELIVSHHDDGHGRCVRCRQQFPCHPRRVITAELLPRVTA